MDLAQNNPRLFELDQLDRTNRVIRLDYSYNTRRRTLDPSRSSLFSIISQGTDKYIEQLAEFAQYSPWFEKIPVSTAPGARTPSWVNGWFPALDSITLYGLLARSNPRRYVEVGSGFSTMFARRAIADHRLRTEIISIDPFPRADIDLICDTVLRQRLEDVDPTFFDELSSDDVLFVDNSHRAFQNSDVTVFFTEILPRLPVGLIYGLHDIYLPWDYPDEWRHRYYNEQYLLASYLIGGAGGDIILSPNAFMTLADPTFLNVLGTIFESSMLRGIEKTGGAFWMRRRPANADQR
jgi:hypothetical protein